jgi:uncharacterized protein (TIGR02646 family)
MHSIEENLPVPPFLQNFLIKYITDNGMYVWELTKEDHAMLMRELNVQFPGCICVFCEQICIGQKGASNAGEVEHFRPRHYFNSLTFEWGNLLYSCRRCNKIKNNNFPGKTDNASTEALLAAEAAILGKNYISPSETDGYVDPRDTDTKAETYFTFNENGWIKAIGDLEDLKWSIARKTIRDIDLNPVTVVEEENLCALRSKHLLMVRDTVAKIREQKGARLARRILKRWCHRDKPFSSIVRWADADGYFN